MIFSGLTKEFSTNLGFVESHLSIGNFPIIEQGESLRIARGEVAQGRPAYLKANKNSKDLMVYLNPEDGGVVTASVVPGLHYVNSHGLGRRLGTTDRLESFVGILKSGFTSPSAEHNVYMLTNNHLDERWKAGYPVGGDSYRSYMGRDNVQDRGWVIGDSLRVVLWSGFVGFNDSRVSERGIVGNIRIVWATPTTDLEGVVVTAPGSDWDARISFYQRLYNENRLLAPIDVYDVRGNHIRIG